MALRLFYGLCCWAVLCSNGFALSPVDLTQLFSVAEHNDPQWRFFDAGPAVPLKKQNRNAPLSPPHEAPKANRIAIIIDDLGYHRRESQRSADLPGQVTLAVIPNSPHASQVARWASGTGKELMLHIPMQPRSSTAWGEGLTSTMDETQLRYQLNRMLDSLPGVRGANNHMGSALTEDHSAMSWIMDELGKRHLYFVDSRTSVHTKAQAAAQLQQLPNARRDVFLDNSKQSADIAAQFEKLLALAKQRGSAIAIGHPYPETLSFLQKALPTLQTRGVELVPASQLVSPPPNAHFRYSQAD